MDTVGIDRSHRRPNPLGGGLRERNGERSPPSSATDGPAELIRRDPMPLSKKKNHQYPVAMREVRAPYVGGFVFFALCRCHVLVDDHEPGPSSNSPVVTVPYTPALLLR